MLQPDRGGRRAHARERHEFQEIALDSAVIVPEAPLAGVVFGNAEAEIGNRAVGLAADATGLPFREEARADGAKASEIVAGSPALDCFIKDVFFFHERRSLMPRAGKARKKFWNLNTETQRTRRRLSGLAADARICVNTKSQTFSFLKYSELPKAA